MLAFRSKQIIFPDFVLNLRRRTAAGPGPAPNAAADSDAIKLVALKVICYCCEMSAVHICNI